MKTIEQTTYVDIDIKSTKFVITINQGDTFIVIEKRNVGKLIEVLKEWVDDE